jgi:zinc/manganese transport system substrate-binding protein
MLIYKGRHMSDKPKPRQHKDLLFGAILLGVFLVVALSLFWFTAMQPGSSDSRLRIVAAQNVWGTIAEQLGGEYVDVTSIVTDPEADPHLYESSARDSLAVAEADIAIVNGAGYDEFFDKLLEASPSSGRRVIRIASVFNVSQDSNPHLWYDLGRIEKVAEAITASLAAKDPGNKTNYEAKLRTFKDSLQPLQAKVADIKKQFSGTPVAYTEPVAAYLLRICGLHNKTPEGFALSMEEGVEPSLADQAALEKLIPPLAIRVLIYNPQAESQVTERIRNMAATAGVAVVEMTETMPSGEATFQSWQLKQLDALLAALKNSKE